MQPAASGRRKRCEHVPGTWAEAFVQPGSTWGQAVVGAPEAVGGNRRAKDVATETLETQAIVFVHGDIGVQRVALEEGAARFGAGGVLGLEDALSRRRHDGFALCDGQGVGLFVGELALGGVLRDQPLDAAGDLQEQSLDLGVGGRREGDEDRRCVLWDATGEDPIGQDAVEVNVEVGHATGPGNRRDCAGARRAGGQRACSAALPGEDHLQEGAKNPSEERAVSGQSEANSLGKGHRPLPIGDPRQHPIHQMRGRVRHPPPVTRRTQPAPLAGEGQRHLAPAVVAPNPAEAQREHATAQEVAEGALHEPRQAKA